MQLRRRKLLIKKLEDGKKEHNIYEKKAQLKALVVFDETHDEGKDLGEGKTGTVEAGQSSLLAVHLQSERIMISSLFLVLQSIQVVLLPLRQHLLFLLDFLCSSCRTSKKSSFYYTLVLCSSSRINTSQ